MNQYLKMLMISSVCLPFGVMAQTTTCEYSDFDEQQHCAPFIEPIDTNFGYTQDEKSTEVLLSMSEKNNPDLEPAFVAPLPNSSLFYVAAKSGFNYITDESTELLLVGESGSRVSAWIQMDSGYVHTDLEYKLRQFHLKVLERYVNDTAIVLPSNTETEKGVLTMFHDPYCRYCLKAKADLKTYQDAGYRVQIVAQNTLHGFSEEAGKRIWGWVNTDNSPMLHMADLVRDIGISETQKTIMSWPIAPSAYTVLENHQTAADYIGLRGTPSFILPNGQIVSGYVTPDVMLELME
ncbi:thioredoxin fold domain-containing protein [Vibrio splendidus]